MKKLISVLLISATGLVVKAQSPDSIRVSITDTLRQLSDCVVRIELSNKGNKKFPFPKNYRVGDIVANADILLLVEKMASDGKYYLYACDASLRGVPNPFNDVVPGRFRRITIIDSMNRLGCIERGKYRMQVCYNNRIADQNEQLIESRSEWVEFYVDAEKIRLSRYLRNSAHGGNR